MRSHLTVWLCIFLLLTTPFTALAQSDPFFDEFQSGNQDAFFEDPYQDTADDPLLQRDFSSEMEMSDEPLPEMPAAEGDPFEEPISEDDQYIDEGTFSDDSESSLRLDLLAQRDIAQQDQQNLIGNVAYGAGTGLMIGGWFTFLRPGTSRDQFRTIGSSTVLGGVVGALIGTRSVWDPGAPRPAGAEAFEATESGPVALLLPDGFRFSYVWSF
jgi:hypothetical protein